ncbi:MAG: hypothetical protein U0271_37055 [Polyangiaceae bacterium]
MRLERKRLSSRGHAVGLSAAVLAGVLSQGSCTDYIEPPGGLQTFHVTIVAVNGGDPPAIDSPLPANTGDHNETWQVDVEARNPDGTVDESFEGVVRLSIEPGTVVAVDSLGTDDDTGRNLHLSGGKGTGIVTVTAMYGDARLWVEDLGYDPAPAGETPACANGVNDDPDEDVLIDFPNDPGCAYADDNSETGSTFAAGTSPPVHYALPTLRDIQGASSTTPFPYESITVNTAGEHYLVVTRLAKDGFYVTDLADSDVGYNHLFAFSFSTPPGVRVCDRVTYLSGTLSEFFGFTELSFPSYETEPIYEKDKSKCRVPEPIVLSADDIEDPRVMESYESGLIRAEGYHVSNLIGPKLALNNVFASDQTNCDFNGDGKIDFESAAEGSCGNACSANTECSEWTGYVARGNYKVSKQTTLESGTPIVSVLQIQTDNAPEFSPVASRGAVLTAITGTLRNFSGGSLNWTIEARCTDDVVCDAAGCTPEILGPKESCLDLRAEEDPDEGTN